MMQRYGIVEREGRGRCFQAAKYYRQGDVVHAEEPYEAVLYDDSAASRCHQTFKPGQHLLRCSGCLFARYSSRDSQKAAWAAGHKEECPALKACAPRVPPATVRLAARVLWKHNRESPGQLGLPGCVEALEHHWDKHSDERKQTFAQMAVLTSKYMAGAKTGDLAEPKLIAFLLSRFACNNHTICDEELQVIGVGLYPVGAMLNHSCTPNAMQSFVGRRIVFRAMQPTAVGQEATISYVELAATRAERRAALLEGYAFDIDSGKVLDSSSPSASLSVSACASSSGTVLEQDARVKPVAEKPLPAVEGAQARLKLYDAPPHVMDPQDASLTRLSSLLGGNAALQRGLEPNGKSYAAHEEDVEEGGPGSSCAPQAHEDLIVIECWCREAEARRENTSGHAGNQGEEELLMAACPKAEVLASAVMQHHHAEAYMSSGDPQSACAIAEQGLQQLDHCLPQTRGHIWRMRLLAILLRGRISAGTCWPEALAAANLLTPFYRELYPQVWPNLGLHYASVAKIASLLEQDDVAVQASQAAVGILKYTYPDSSILQEQLQLIHNLQNARNS